MHINKKKVRVEFKRQTDMHATIEYKFYFITRNVSSCFRSNTHFINIMILFSIISLCKTISTEVVKC